MRANFVAQSPLSGAWHWLGGGIECGSTPCENISSSPGLGNAVRCIARPGRAMVPGWVLVRSVHKTTPRWVIGMPRPSPISETCLDQCKPRVRYPMETGVISQPHHPVACLLVNILLCSRRRLSCVWGRFKSTDGDYRVRRTAGGRCASCHRLEHSEERQVQRVFSAERLVWMHSTRRRFNVNSFWVELSISSQSSPQSFPAYRYSHQILHLEGSRAMVRLKQVQITRAGPR